MGTVDLTIIGGLLGWSAAGIGVLYWLNCQHERSIAALHSKVALLEYDMRMLEELWAMRSFGRKRVSASAGDSATGSGPPA